MAPYMQAFLDELERRGQDRSQWLFSSGESPTLTLQARNLSTGSLVLSDDCDELTLEIGHVFHCHFDGTGTNEYGTDRMRSAALLAADYAHRVVTDRIGIAVHYNETHCIGAALIYLDDCGLLPENLHASAEGLYGGHIRTERFLWSGPVENPT